MIMCTVRARIMHLPPITTLQRACANPCLKLTATTLDDNGRLCSNGSSLALGCCVSCFFICWNLYDQQSIVDTRESNIKISASTISWILSSSFCHPRFIPVLFGVICKF
uniref:Putative secreted protein n=1 Tax=Anopheles triannulatus TaxID=58253 RepID=A0A2M4B6M9_9DIPT